MKEEKFTKADFGKKKLKIKFQLLKMFIDQTPSSAFRV
jgi:hypothetical protein